MGANDRDVTRADAVDRELGRFIESRARAFEREAETERQKMWSDSVRAYREDLAAQHTEAWRLYFERQARLHEYLAQQNRDKAEKLFSDQ